MSRPTYLRIADDLRHRIKGGELSPGARLPSRAQLSRRYTVSDRVAVEAIKVLMNEGLVEGRPGSGTYVRRRPEVRRIDRGAPETSPAEGLTGVLRTASATVTVPRAVAGRLRIDPGAEVVRTDRLFLEDGEPVMLGTSWEPLEFARGVPGRRGPAERTAAGRVTVTRTVETISARPAVEAESERLGLPRGSVVIVLCRIGMADERPVETAEFVFAAESNELCYEFDVGGAAPGTRRQRTDRSTADL